MSGPHLVGGFGAEKTDADLLALFTTADVLAAVNTHLATSYATVKPLALKTQVVAGTNFRVKAEADGQAIVITAFKGLPHTGGAVEVKSVEASHASF